MPDEFDELLGSSAEDEEMQMAPEPPSEEELHARIDALAQEPLHATGKTPSPESVAEAKRIVTAGMTTARSLLPEGYDEDEGDFEPGGLYKGFRIIPQHLWPDEPRHAARWPTRFYVSTDKDTPGLVPWVGSQIVWPWERAWHVDLHREQVQSFLKEEKKEKKK